MSTPEEQVTPEQATPEQATTEEAPKKKDTSNYKILARDAKGRIMKGGVRKTASSNPVARQGSKWRNAMFEAWEKNQCTTEKVQLAWLKGQRIKIATGVYLDFRDKSYTTAKRYIEFQKMFAGMSPKEIAVEQEIDPDVQAAQIAKDESITTLMEALHDELDKRARVLDVTPEQAEKAE